MIQAQLFHAYVGFGEISLGRKVYLVIEPSEVPYTTESPSYGVKIGFGFEF